MKKSFRKTNPGKKSQLWYIDFIAAMIIFISGFLVFVIYTNNILQNSSGSNDPDSIISTTSKISELLFSKGIQSNQINGSLETQGIICDSGSTEICPKKLDALFSENYENLRNSLGTRFDLHIYLSYIEDAKYNANETTDELKVISLGSRCGINVFGMINRTGMNSSNSTTGNSTNLPDRSDVAIYTDAYDENINATGNPFRINNTFDHSTIDEFFSRLDSFNIIILYNPDLSRFNISQKARLQKFIYDGKVIIGSGKMNSEFLEINYTGSMTTNITSKIDRENYGSTISKNSYILLKNDSRINKSIQEIRIANQYLKDKTENQNSNSYEYLINSNVSEFLVIQDVKFNNTDLPTIFYEKYNLGKFYYFYDLFEYSNITGIVNDTIGNLDIEQCTVKKSDVIKSSYRTISKIDRIGTFNGKIVKLTVISYEDK